MKPSELTSNIASVLLVGVFLVAKCASAQSASPDDDWKQYQFILQRSTLEWLSTQPFLLKLDYQLYDLDGNPLAKGTAEESWTRSNGKQIRIQSPNLSEDTSVADNGHKNHIRESYLVHQAINSLARPFSIPPKQSDFAIDKFRKTVTGTERDCFVLTLPGQHTETSEAYCIDVDNNIVAMTGRPFVLERTNFRKYLSHEIPTDLTLSYEGRTALTMHVTELDPLPAEPDALTTKKASGASPRIPGIVMAGLRLTHKDPEYPKEAKKKHIWGIVLVMAVITKEGKITAMDIVASPDVMLSKSALDAVGTWTYRPYILNGAPTEVDTSITVNYNPGK